MNSIREPNKVMIGTLIAKSISKQLTRLTIYILSIRLNGTNFFISDRLETQLTKLREIIIETIVISKMLRQNLRISRVRHKHNKTHNIAVIIEEMLNRMLLSIKRSTNTSKLTELSSIRVIRSRNVSNLGSIDNLCVATKENRHVKLLMFGRHTKMTKDKISVTETSTERSLKKTSKSITITEIRNSHT